MKNADTLISPEAVLEEMVRMLNRRGVSTNDMEVIDVPDTQALWSLYIDDEGGAIGCVCVPTLDKPTAIAILTAMVDMRHIIIVYTRNTTTDGIKELKASEQTIEWWHDRRLYLNVFKTDFIVDAGILSKDDVRYARIVRLLADDPPTTEAAAALQKLPKILESDHLRQFLGAKLGDVVWILKRTGPLNPTTTYRLVCEDDV